MSNDNQASPVHPKRSGGNLFPWAMIIAALLLIIVLFFLLLIVVTYWKVPNELGLPVLAIFGVVTLLASLSFVAISFNRVGMSDKTQALALPQGSVRAVIALSLVVLFAILSVYLFSSLNNPGSVQREWCLDQSGRNDLARSLNARELMLDRLMTRNEITEHCSPISTFGEATSPSGLPAPLTAPTTPTAGQPAQQLFVVGFRDLANSTAEDFAKQLLVLIGTLVTAVASFYFGAKAVAEAHDAVLGINLPPSLTGINPTTLSPGPNSPLDVLGHNLNSVKQVQLTLQGSQPITATSVTSNDNRASATLSIPPGTPAGPWDVIVSDGQGRSDRLASALTVGASQSGSTSQSDRTNPSTADAGTSATVPVRLGIDRIADLQGIKLEVDGRAVALGADGFVELVLTVEIAHLVRATAQRGGKKVQSELTIKPSLDDVNAAYELALT